MQRDFTSELKPSTPGGNILIELERARSSIPVDALSEFILGKDWLQMQRRLLPLLTDQKLLSKRTQMNLSRPDRYLLGLARAKLLRRMADQHHWSDEEYEMAKYLVDDVSPYTLHTTMFRQTLREQASDEQQQYWLPKHGRWEVIGAYAQTEMGHGSNVRGIETEARWDPATKTFILHSPTLTSSKWWNGSLGRTATHAIVVAQLLVPEKTAAKHSVEYERLGPHHFVVQVRDKVTHQPLDGIVVGDIGPKYGYAPMDNAFMLFKHHRIPHDAMLSRYAKLDPDSSIYTKPDAPNVVYGSLTEARSRIVHHARLVLARAVTVAVRYTTIRRQFKDKDDESEATETSVIDYSTVQIRIVPLLATVFALHFTGQVMKETFLSNRERIAQSDFSGMAELHSLSSGLKSLCTDLAANGIETCRRAMGGHGYGGYSGLVQLNADYLSKPTVEGDNWMITQQVARYLMKVAKRITEMQGTKQDTRAEKLLEKYQVPQSGANFSILNDHSALADAFEHRAARMTFRVYEEKVKQGRSENEMLIKMHQLSHAYSYSILIRNFHDQVTNLQNFGQETINVMWDLYTLFALFTMQNNALEFIQTETVSLNQLDEVPGRILELMRRIRPHAVRLVDVWALPDYLLDSSLGRYDGRVYEDMFHRAHDLNPLNRITINPDYKNPELVLGSGNGDTILAKL
ncbi:acyl-CoA oxidase [Trichoderma sp. SZMC 28013]